LNSPERKLIAAASPVKISGVALNKTWPIP